MVEVYGAESSYQATNLPDVDGGRLFALSSARSSWLWHG